MIFPKYIQQILSILIVFYQIFITIALYLRSMLLKSYHAVTAGGDFVVMGNDHERSLKL